MKQERWEDIIATIKDKFEVTRHETVELDEDEGPGQVELVEFSGPLGEMRLTWTTRPVVLDKKTLGSRRIGSDTAVKYVYSDTEVSHTFKAYKQAADGEFIEMEMEAEAFSL